MELLIKVLAAINERIARVGRVAAGMVLAAMLVVIVLQVASRYVFNNSLSWTEELSKSLMVWCAFLVAPWALRSSAHVGIDMFVEAMPKRGKFLVEMIVSGLVLWILFVLFSESLEFVARGLKSRMSTLPVTTGYVYAIVPASLAAMMLCGAELVLRQAREFASGVEDAEAPHRAAPTAGE